MARMHSGAKGQSSSKRPLEVGKKNEWVRYNAEEAEMLVVKLAKKGTTPSMIGMNLRDQYGIPHIKEVTGKSITKILNEHGESLEIPEDLKNLMMKYVNVVGHYDKNHHDKTAKRGIMYTYSKIKRLVDYYKKQNKLPQDFRFSLDVAKRYTI